MPCIKYTQLQEEGEDRHRTSWDLIARARRSCGARRGLLRSVELLVDQVQEQVHVELEVALEEVHELVGLELRLEEVLDGDEGAGAGHLDVSAGALDGEDTDFVAADGDVDLVVVGDAGPGDEDALVGELAG